MIRAVIHVDGLAYQGEDPDRTYQTTPQAGGFHAYTGGEVNALVFNNEPPMLIEGSRNLASHVQRILTRLQDGHMTAERISIRVLPEGAQ